MPAEVEQDGRILRQGNDNPEVSIYRYVTEGSFDAYMWQALETKARFISQVMSGENTARKAEDVGGQELSYAEVKAIASGNPAVLTLAEADAELKRLSILKKNHSDEQFLARRNIRELPDKVRRLTDRLASLEADIETEQPDAPLTIGSREIDRADEVEALGKRMEALPDKVSENRHVQIGKFHGLEFGFVLTPSFPPEAYLQGRAYRQTMLSRNAGPRAVLNALSRLIESYPSEVRDNRRELAVSESQLVDYQQRLGKTFDHEQYMADLTRLRDQLRVGMSEAPKEDQPSVSELAERIKSLKSSQVIDSGPARSEARIVSAEEPVTAKIKRLAETQASVDAQDGFTQSVRRSVTGHRQMM